MQVNLKSWEKIIAIDYLPANTATALILDFFRQHVERLEILYYNEGTQGTIKVTFPDAKLSYLKGVTYRLNDALTGFMSGEIHVQEKVSRVIVEPLVTSTNQAAQVVVVGRKEPPL